MPIDIASTQESSANVVAVATAAASGAGASKDEDVLTNKNGGGWLGYNMNMIVYMPPVA